jgi:hypothetical protein
MNDTLSEDSRPPHDQGTFDAFVASKLERETRRDRRPALRPAADATHRSTLKNWNPKMDLPLPASAPARRPPAATGARCFSTYPVVKDPFRFQAASRFPAFTA